MVCVIGGIVNNTLEIHTNTQTMKGINNFYINTSILAFFNKKYQRETETLKLYHDVEQRVVFCVIKRSIYNRVDIFIQRIYKWNASTYMHW